MDTREWALLIFTILAQLAVGILLVNMVVRAYTEKKLGSELAAKLYDIPLFTVLPTMGLALVASLFHLGKVSHVIGAVPNLGTSWMSREVVLAVSFAVLVAIYTFLVWRKSGSAELRTSLGWIAAIVGLILIYAMGMTYMLPAQPAFNTFATPVTFFAAMLLLGALGFAAALMAANSRLAKQDPAAQEAISRTIQGVSLAAIVLLGIEFLVMPFYMAYLSTQGAAALKSLSMMVGEFGFVLALRLVLVFIGAGVMAAYLYRSAAAKSLQVSVASYVYGAFLLVVVSEIMGRFLFYATAFRIGV